MLYQLQQLRILPEEVLAQISPILRLEGLVVAIDALFHPPQQQSGMIALKQRVPVRAPHHLDHIPSRAEEHSLKLVDDPLVPAHRPIQPLQVAVDDEDEV